MARDKLTEYSATASENTVCGDVNIAENSALPSDLNNYAREIMTHLKNFSDGTDAIDALAVDNLKLDGNTISSTDTNGNITLDADGTGLVSVSGDALKIEDDSTDAAVGPTLDLYRNSSSPADSDLLGQIQFHGEDDAGNKEEYAKIRAQAIDVSSGTEDATLAIQTKVGGAGRERIKLTPSETVFNDDGIDLNFRVESDSSTHALFLNSGANRVNINSSANPSENCQLYVNDVALIGHTNAVTGGFPTSGLGVITAQGSYCAVFYDDNALSVPRFTFRRNGQFMVKTTNQSAGSIGSNGEGVSLGFEGGEGGIQCSRAGAECLTLNRNSSDGMIVRLRQNTNTEGNISVSGTTISYNGGHLSRYSQAADGNRITGLVKGTVMTNLDQMAVWSHDEVLWTEDDELPDGVSVGDVRTAAYTEENEQLNCMAVSSVEGDANVAGVFVNWDDEDPDFTADMNVAMTGDMVIRIASGTTVARGDLLMSAGDGTAKPQGDDIVRSKTIAKVTSTTVSHTYDDGTYLVPCVLMAC